MQEQLDLIGFPEPEGFGVPNDGEPLFWIKEMRVLSKMDASADSLIRTVKFRTGLNVVWSPPTDNEPTADQRLSGHASGKTTLCRMIRYVLGEQKIGTENFRSAITHKYPEGVVVAEVRLDGETWSVARPFTAWTSAKGWARRGVELDAFLADPSDAAPYEEFKTTLEAAAKKIVPFDKLPDGSPLTLWHYFPWFTRDQEAQFLKLYAWRENTSSEADSPMLKQEQKAFVMRSIYDPAAADELDLITRYEQLGVEIEQAQKDEIKLSGACESDREWLSQLDETKGLDVDNELMCSTRIDELKVASERAEIVPLDVSTKRTMLEMGVQRAFRELEDARIVLSQCLDFRKIQYNRLNDLQRAANETVTPPPPQEDRVEAAAKLKPDRRFCAVPLIIAHQRGCKVVDEYVQDETQKKEAAEIIHKVAVESVESQTAKVRELEDKIAEARKDVEVQQKNYDNALVQRDNYDREVQRGIREKVQVFSSAIASIERYRVDAKKLSDVRKLIENNKNLRKDISAQLTCLRNSRTSSADVSLYFHHVIQYILGSKVVGKVVADKSSVTLECSFNDNKYNSAALDAAYNVMFDLTVLVMAIQGKSKHPKFLLHDGPRVADISPAIYHRYFEFAEDLERRAKGRPNFQYIITTTEPPPERFKVEPYLRLKLDASRPEDRLLKCNL